MMTQSMDKGAYSFKSSATYRAGGGVHFKEKRRSLWPARRLWLMTREVTSKPSSRTSSPTIKIHRSPETLQWQIRLGIPGKPLLWIGGNANSISPSGAQLLAAGSLLMTISKLKTPFSQVCIASMSIIRRGVCLWS